MGDFYTSKLLILTFLQILIALVAFENIMCPSWENFNQTEYHSE